MQPYLEQPAEARYAFFGTGKFADEHFRNLIREGYAPIFFIDNDSLKHGKKINGIDIVGPEDERITDDVIIIILTYATNYIDIVEQLLSLGISEERILVAGTEEVHSNDFFQIAGWTYKDTNNNYIQCDSPNFVFKLSTNALNNHIVIGRGITNEKTVIGIDGSNNLVVIKDGYCFGRGTHMDIRGGGTSLEIGNHLRACDDFSLELFSNCRVLIGDNCTVNNPFSIRAHWYSSVEIGRDCMISYDVSFLSGDGHSMFDIPTGKRINSGKSSIVIGNHVWIGEGARVLGGNKGTTIGEGSIIGAYSVVKGNVPNNVSVAGNPASVIKENVAWARKYNRAVSMEDMCNGFCRETQKKG